jgi:DNA-binding transcriptional ArsR family regulator
MSDAAETSGSGPDDPQFVLETLDAIKAVADPLRIRILFETTYFGRTVKELSALLDVPQTRLYYHVKLLERQGLLMVVERRMVSGIEERRYRSPTNGFTISPKLIGQAVDSGLLTAMLDLTAAELGVALSAETSEPGQPDSNVPILTFNRMWLDPDDIPSFIKGLGGLIERYDAREPTAGHVEYHGLFTMYIHPQVARADDAS